MKREVTHYAEATKKNIVAAVRSGLSQNSISRRLGIPGTTVNQWLKNPKYSDIGPASQEVLDALPPDPSKFQLDRSQRLVQVQETASIPSAATQPRCGMKISLGRLTFESESFTSEDIFTIVKALADAHVL